MIRPRSFKPPTRRASAAVELAIVLPVIMTVVLGTIEVCQRAFLRQTAVLTAYEGARLAVRRTSTSAQVLSRSQAFLTNRRVTGGSVTLNPANIETQPTGTRIQVAVTVPWAGNTPVSFVLGGSSNISVSATMVRE